MTSLLFLLMIVTKLHAVKKYLRIFAGARSTKENILDDMHTTPSGITMEDKYYFGFFIMNPQSTHFWKNENDEEFIMVCEL